HSVTIGWTSRGVVVYRRETITMTWTAVASRNRNRAVAPPVLPPLRARVRYAFTAPRQLPRALTGAGNRPRPRRAGTPQRHWNGDGHLLGQRDRSATGPSSRWRTC